MDRRIVNATAAPMILRALLQSHPATAKDLAIRLQAKSPNLLRTRLLTLVEKGLVRLNCNARPGRQRSGPKNPDTWEIPDESKVHAWLEQFEEAKTGDTTFGDNPFDALQAIFGVAARKINNLPGRQHVLGVGVTEL